MKTNSKDDLVFWREKTIFQFQNDRTFFVMNLTKSWIFLQKYSNTILRTYTKMISTLCPTQPYENK